MPQRTGERSHKSLHGCVVDANLNVLNMLIAKKGGKDTAGLNDNTVLWYLGPQKGSGMAAFNLCQYL